MPLPQDVHVDRPLSNFAVEYKNEKMIAGSVMPVVQVDKKSDEYFIYDKKDRFTRAKTIRGPKAEANEVDWHVSTAAYKAIDHALKEFLPDSVAANADAPIVPRQKTVQQLIDLILMEREIRVMTLATTYSGFGAAYRIQLSGDDQLDQYTTSDPISVIDTGKAACFIDPNTIIMGKQVYDKIKRHPQLLDHVKGGATTAQPAKVTLELMAEVFEVDRIIVGASKYNTANKGQTASYSYIWGKDIVLAYIDPRPAMIGVAWAKTFQWKQMATEIGYKVRSWRDETRGGGGEVLETETSFDEKIVCSDLAYLIDTAIS